MNTKRLLAVPAIAAVSLLALTGCFQPPALPGTETQAPADAETSESGELAGTTWRGVFDNARNDFVMFLNEDGTIDISEWGDEEASYNAPQDVWEGDASSLTVTITGLENGAFDVTLTGAVSGSQMTLSGTGTDGNTYSLSATQE